MKRIVYVILLLGILLESSQAQQVVFGRVKNENDNPLVDVNVFQQQYYNMSRTDSRGIFSYVVDSSLVDTLTFDRVGYAPFQIAITDTMTSPVHIELQVDEEEWRRVTNRHWSPQGGGLRFNADIITEKFDAFEKDLGRENIETLNRMAGIFSMELLMKGRYLQTGFSFGFIETDNVDPDSINIDLRNTLVGLSLSYLLIDQAKFYLYPNFSFKHYRYRLINSQFEDDLTLSQFVTNPDWDLRLNQSVGVVGFESGFKFRTKNMVETAYWAIGAYGGYLFKLHGRPVIRSTQSRILPNETIDVRNFNFGIFFSMNFQ